MEASKESQGVKKKLVQDKMLKFNIIYILNEISTYLLETFLKTTKNPPTQAALARVSQRTLDLSVQESIQHYLQGKMLSCYSPNTSKCFQTLIDNLQNVNPRIQYASKD